MNDKIQNRIGPYLDWKTQQTKEKNETKELKCL